jgi:hypothetical protein
MDVREKWSGRSFSLKKPWTARREFTVAPSTANETFTEFDALAATGIPQKAEPHPDAPLLWCEGPVISEVKGPYFFVITCDYSHDPKTQGEDPLDDDPIITWEPMEEALPCDADLDHLPIVNTAAFPITGLTQPVNYFRLTIVKNMPTFDVNLAINYANSCNNAPMSLGGIVTVATEHFKCCTIGPAGSYTPNAQFIPMRFVFEVFFDNSRGTYPFQHRVLDAGQTGWKSGPTAEKFHASGEDSPVSEDIRLDGTGKPLVKPYGSGRIKVGSDGTPISPTTVPTYYKLEAFNAAGALQSAIDANTNAVFLYYKRTRVVDLSPLTALL